MTGSGNLILILLLFVSMISCETEDHMPLKTWYLSSARVQTTSCCTFQADVPDSPCDNHNPIFSALLGLTNSNIGEITLSMNDVAFVISHDKQPVALGTIQIIPNGLRLVSHDHTLLVRNVFHAGDSLLLNPEDDGNLSDVRMVFKADEQ